MKQCPKCSHKNSDGAKFCTNCGCNLDISYMPHSRQQLPSNNQESNFYGQAPQQPNPQKKRNRNIELIISIALGVLVFICVISSIFLLNNNDTETDASDRTQVISESTTSAPLEQAVKVSVGDIINAYEENEVNADNLYKNKILEITGVVDSVGKDILNDTYIKITTGEQYEVWGAQCYIKDSELEDAAELRSGDTITIVGTCSGYSVNVVLNDCEIKN